MVTRLPVAVVPAVVTAAPVLMLVIAVTLTPGLVMRTAEIWPFAFTMPLAVGAVPNVPATVRGISVLGWKPKPTAFGKTTAWSLFAMPPTDPRTKPGTFCAVLACAFGTTGKFAGEPTGGAVKVTAISVLLGA